MITIAKKKTTTKDKLNYVCENADLWLVLALRIAIGIIFVMGGLFKLGQTFGGTALAPFQASIWAGAPLFWQFIAGAIEFLGGLGVILGIAPRSSSILLGLVMFLAIITVHLNGTYANALILLASLGIVFSKGFKRWAAWHKW